MADFFHNILILKSLFSNKRIIIFHTFPGRFPSFVFTQQNHTCFFEFLYSQQCWRRRFGKLFEIFNENENELFMVNIESNGLITFHENENIELS